MRLLLTTFAALLSSAFICIGHAAEPAAATAPLVEFILTSDVHFGITRVNFQGAVNVNSQLVNAALVQKINRLPNAVLPDDHGLMAGEKIGAIDFVAITGDLANRQELLPVPIQSAAVSWSQFEATYIKGLTLKDRSGHSSQLLLVPGNHDASNAVGAPQKMQPLTDATSMAEIYNRMMHPETPRTKDTYNYATDKVYYSKNFSGVHCIFLTIWPEAIARAWMETDLKDVPASTPVFIFVHDPPEGDVKHLTNPNGNHDINDHDKFENLLADRLADGTTTDAPTTIEARAFVTFLKAHKNIVAYFHGHSNWNEFYTWKGPDGDIALNAFRADSPMKGKISAKDETKLSFQLIIFDPATQKLTARECLWNASATDIQTSAPVAWGQSITVSTAPR